jgi:hypothetical protein
MYLLTHGSSFNRYLWLRKYLRLETGYRVVSMLSFVLAIIPPTSPPADSGPEIPLDARHSLVIVPLTESLKVHYGKVAMLERSKHLTNFEGIISV